VTLLTSVLGYSTILGVRVRHVWLLPIGPGDLVPQHCNRCVRCREV